MTPLDHLPLPIATTGTAPTEATAWWNRWRPAWHADAACASNQVATFFPTRGEPTEPAIVVCSSCPVRAACLAEALADPTLDFGVRGGLSVRARKQLRARFQAEQRTAIDSFTQSATERQACASAHAPISSDSTRSKGVGHHPLEHLFHEGPGDGSQCGEASTIGLVRLMNRRSSAT